MRPCSITLNATALRHNLLRVRQLAGRRCIWAVVKANAYGHGLVWSARVLAKGVDGFAVASLEEALQLREAGLSHPILLLEGLFEPKEAVLAQSLQVHQVIHAPKQVRWLQEQDADAPWQLWLKLDTGMHRLGIPPEKAEAWLRHLKERLPNATVHAMTHFACADMAGEKGDRFTRQQYQRFQAAVGDVRKALAGVSLSNSAALIRHPFISEQWVRPGIMLYGATDLDRHLKPVMTFRARLIHLQWIRAGECVGYDASWQAERMTLVGVVSAGYGDGYPRHAAPGTPVWVAGARVPLIGRVSMDMITVDLTDHPRRDQLRAGETVELWGTQVPVTEVAERADTIAYTLCCGITQRVHRYEED